MKILNKFFIFFYFLFTINCSSVYSVSYDYDRSLNLVKLKTYNWLPVSEKADLNIFDLKRIKHAVDNGLKDKGLKTVSDDPDFLITAHLVKKDKVNITNWGYGFNRRYWGFNDVKVYQYEEGTFILDVIDPESKDLLWRGSAKTDLNHTKTPEKRDLLIIEVVQNILQYFPPPMMK